MLFLPSFAFAEVPQGVMGFMDGKLYTQQGFSSGIPDYICFMDSNCYNKEMQWVFMREVQSAITELQNKVNDLQNQINNTQTSNSTIIAIDKDKATRVKNEINSYINNLNKQINILKDTPFPDGSLNHNYYTISQIESNPLSFNNSIFEILRINSAEYNKINEQINNLQVKIKEINAVLIEVNDYFSTGIILSSWDRAYLQSLGINW